MALIKSFTKIKKLMSYITLYPIIYISNQASKHAKTKKISYLNKFQYKPLPGKFYTYNSSGNTIYFLAGAFNLKANKQNLTR